MKKFYSSLACILILVLIVTVYPKYSQAVSPIVLVAHTSQTGNTPTTSAINTTGATLLIAGISMVGNVNSETPTDSKGNTWHRINVETNGSSGYTTIWYAYDHGGSPLSVGSGETVTGGANTYGITVEAFSGTQTTFDPLDAQNGAASVSGATGQAGSITPALNNELVVAYNGSDIGGTANTYTIGSGLTITDQLGFSSAVTYGQGLAYIVQTTAGAVNPTWSSSGSFTSGMVIASFKAIPANNNLVAHAGTATAGASVTATTAGINTTGATLLVATVQTLDADSTLNTMADSNGNTWHHLANSVSSGIGSGSIWYAYDKSGGSLVVGAGQTFSYGPATYPDIQVMAFSGTLTGSDPFDQQNNTSTNGSTTAQPGSITPTQANETVVTQISGNWTTSININSGLNITDSQEYGSFMGGAAAYITQTTAAAINPTWMFGNGPNAGVSIASFKAAASVTVTATQQNSLMAGKMSHMGGTLTSL